MKKIFIANLLLCTMSWSTFSNSELIKTSLLIKIPTRSRPEKLFKTLDAFYDHLSYEIPVLFVISCDTDDFSMNNPAVINRLKAYPNLIYSFHRNKSKIEAFNRDLELYDFEIVIGAQDDTQPTIKGFDLILYNTMHEQFPDLDGVINFNDGHIGAKCNTLPVIGKKFYERFNYYYHPDYKALVCDVEITNVSKMLKREYYLDQNIITHDHPAWGNNEYDELYIKNEYHHAADVQTFVQRQAKLYDLSPEQIESATPKMWSILIYLEPHKLEAYNNLHAMLLTQIEACGLQDEIEILTHTKTSSAECRYLAFNQLMNTSSGRYVQFIDPSDTIHDSFIELVYEKMQKNPDCVGLHATVTFKGNSPQIVVHSRQYDHYFEKDAVYFRPPNTLNPIKRFIAIQFPFHEEIEQYDLEWAKRLTQSQLIRTEETIEIPFYFFRH